MQTSAEKGQRSQVKMKNNPSKCQAEGLQVPRPQKRSSCQLLSGADWSSQQPGSPNSPMQLANI